MVIKMYEPLYSDKVALKDMATLEEQYHGTACLEYASVGSVRLLKIGLAGLNFVADSCRRERILCALG